MKQHFVRDPVPYSRAEGLVEEEGLDGAFAVGDGRVELGKGGHAEDRIEPECGDRWLGERGVAEPDAREAAGVDEDYFCWGV